MKLTLGESDYAGPIPEDEILGAEFVDCREVVKPWKDDQGQPVEKLEFSFFIAEPDSPWDGLRIWGETTTKFVDHPDCRSRAWFMELLGIDEMPQGFQFETDDLKGSRCRVVIGSREYEKNGETHTRNFVKDLIRAKGGPMPLLDEEPF